MTNHAWALLAVLVLTAADQRLPPVGQKSTVCGRVVTYFNPDDDPRGCSVRLDLGRPYWSPKFYVLIPANAVANFVPPPVDAYLLQDICVTGIVEKDGSGVRYIGAVNPANIEVSQPRPRQPFGGGAFRPCASAEAPKLIREVKPSYTRRAMDKKIEGRVLMEAVVGVDGTVIDARVIYPLEDGLDQQALQALKRWRFRPGTHDGGAIAMLIQVEMTFTLH